MVAAIGRTGTRFAWLIAVVLGTMLVLVPAARADYAEVGHFAKSGEAEQLQDSTAMAVNVTGAGGVEPGSIYVVARNNRVVRYGPGHEGEESPLKEIWPPVVSGGGFEYGHFSYPAGIAVDQVTGDVYVLNSGSNENNLIEVFSATGTGVAHFGELGRHSPSPAESIEEGPEKLHVVGSTTSGIAVDSGGKVYVPDNDNPNIANPPGEARVMCFRPETPGHYEHYVYCGRGEDIKLGPTFVGSTTNTFSRIALDEAGHLIGSSSGSIKEYALASPTAPICTYQVPGGGLQAMTANPATGEVFYFSAKDRKIHRLAACDPVTGKFEEVQEAVKPSPETKGMLALVVNPTLSWGEGRPPGVLYGADGENHFELVPPQHGIGDVFAPAPVRKPTVEAESVAGTTTDSSTLQAEIDPHGFATSYFFEYLSAGEYEAGGEAFAGARRVPAAPAQGEIGGGAMGIATGPVSGLAPDTEYAFRVVATSECEGAGEPLCEATGETAFFATYPAAPAGPPDDRAYELVSPPDKNGGEVFPAEAGIGSCGEECKPPGGTGGVTAGVFPMQSTTDGNGVVYEGFPFSANEGSAVFNSYLSRRTTAGWRTTAVSPLLQETKGGLGTLAFDPQFTDSLIGQKRVQLSPSALPGYANLYTQATDEPQAFTPLLTQRPPDRTEVGFEVEFAGRSSDLSRIFFTANDSLTGEAPGIAPPAPDPGRNGRELYEWHEGRLALVSVLPGNASAPTDAAFASRSPDAHAVSENGSRVYWSDGAGQLYVREGGDVTREIPGTSASVTFLSASADGSRVLLSNGKAYSFDPASGEYEEAADLTEGEGGFQGISGQTPNLSHLYFVDTAALPGAGENEAEEEAEPGKDNLYSWQEGSLAFIATLLGTDNNPAEGAPRSDPADWAAQPSLRTAEVSPDGRFLAFASKAPLTGYENVGPCELSNEGVRSAPCTEVFLYDSAAGRLTCASCNPTGEAPLGNSILRRIQDIRQEADRSNWLPQPRYLTDSGRLFFDSADRLSPRDVNGAVEDVYELEPSGAGTCTRAQGCVSLISTGAGTNDSNFLAMDETGANAFFTTRERLVSRDKDGLIDLYDAREGGGFAGEEQLEPGECSGEACRSQTPSPITPFPGTTDFAGSGNVGGQQPCPKGKVRKHGKCVKKHHKKKKKHHRKHHKHRARGKSGGRK